MYTMLNKKIEKFRNSLATLKVDTTYNYEIISVYREDGIDVVSNFYFSIKVNIYNEHISGYSIKLYGKSENCVDMNIDGEPFDERFRDFVKPNIAKFVKIRYDKDCNISGNLHSASGTNHILQLCLYLVSFFFPNVTQFEFRDSSARKCSDLSIFTINSNTYFIALFSSTWYEGLYGAYLSNPRHRELYNSCIKRLTDENLKSNITFRDFSRLFTINVSGQSRIDFQKLQDIYNYSRTFREFFDLIKEAFEYNKRDKIDREKICELLAPWVDTFIKKYILNNEENIDFFTLEWYIDANKVTIPTILEFTIGAKGSFAGCAKKIHGMVGSGNKNSNGIYMLINSCCYMFD
jgi:hypothetical protein